MRLAALLFLLAPIFCKGQIIVDKAGDGWDLKIDSAINLIKQYDSTKYNLLLNVCNKIEFWNGNYSTNDGKKTIVVSVNDVKLNSLNNLASVVIHESFHLYLSEKSLNTKKEENMCYRYELSFIKKLPNIEEWLWNHTLKQIIITE